MRTRVSLLAVAVASAAVVMPGTAIAHPERSNNNEQFVGEGVVDGDAQHGGEGGHLPKKKKNVRVLSKLRLTDIPGRIADVTVHKNTAYLAAFNEPCGRGGVYIVDISDIRNPQRTGFIETGEGSYVGEGVHVLSVNTRKFTGDVLTFNNEICGESDTTVGGATLVDVTNPRKPKVLAEGFGDDTDDDGVANTVHSALSWNDGRKAYSVLVDNEELTDVDIFDISNPARPRMVAEYDLAEKFPRILQSQPDNLTSVFFHDVTVKNIRDRQTMVASYWDAGYVKLDVSDPTAIRYLGDTDFKATDPELLESTGDTQPPEGNGHQSEFTKGNRSLIGADEDFAPYRSEFDITDGPNPGGFPASEGAFTTPIATLDDRTLAGSTTYGGQGCAVTSGDVVPPATEDGDATTDEIAVLQRGACTFQEKADAAEEAGYDGFIVFNNEEGGDAIINMGGDGSDLPGIFVGHTTGLAIFDAASADELTVGDSGADTNTRAIFDGWGYVHLFGTGPKMRELDTYAIPEAHQPEHAFGSGDLSVHEVAASKQDRSTAYLSYYSGGFRVLDVRRGKLREVGAFIARGGSNIWGVEVFRDGGKEYVAASDRDSGLYILKYTGGR
ncbi:MAG: PA domain-containing protein [Nocardioides sp.]